MNVAYRKDLGTFDLKKLKVPKKLYKQLSGVEKLLTVRAKCTNGDYHTIILILELKKIRLHQRRLSYNLLCLNLELPNPGLRIKFITVGAIDH